LFFRIKWVDKTEKVKIRTSAHTQIQTTERKEGLVDFKVILKTYESYGLVISLVCMLMCHSKEKKPIDSSKISWLK
jgi:hypothetical protein